MANTSFELIDVSSIIGYIVVDSAKTVPEYFARLIDSLFNRPGEIKAEGTKLTKTEIRQMYKLAYPRAKV